MRNQIVLIFLIPFLCVACAVGPKYKEPEMQVPTQYKEASGAESDLWKPAQPKDELSRGNWWELYGDPQLNALEERVSVSNQSLKAAEAQYREALAVVRENRAGYFPEITTNPSVTVSQASRNRSVNIVSSGGSGVANNTKTITTYSLPADISYEVDVWGRIRKSVSAAAATAQATAADLETVRLSLQVELASDYLVLRASDAEKQILDSTIADYEKALQLTQIRHDGGVASGVDVAQAKTQLETTRAQAIDISLQRAQVEHAIALLTGQPPAGLSLSPKPLEGTPPTVPLELPSQLLERRPDVAAAERRVAAANAQIGVATAAFFPALTLNAAGGFQSGSVSNWLSWPSRFWSLGPALLQTIFDGGRRHAISDQAWAAYDATVANYRQTALTAFQEVEDNLAALRILEQETTAQEAAVSAAQNSLQISNDRYEGGITTYLEVLTAQNALLTNKRTALQLLQRRLTASLLLIKALGGGWTAPTQISQNR